MSSLAKLSFPEICACFSFDINSTNLNKSCDLALTWELSDRPFIYKIERFRASILS